MKEQQFLNFDSPEVKKCILALKEIDFELVYLAILTCEGIKPLSRWEKPLDNQGLELLQQLGLPPTETFGGLLTRQIMRRVKTGAEVIETIFSRSPGYIQLYEQCFANTPVDKSADTQQFEGYLFGYPPCCIEQYIRQPYAPNNLPKDEQKILFHWACKDCKITPILLPAYKRVHNLLEKLVSGD
jgi:hypothetical protein